MKLDYGHFQEISAWLKHTTSKKRDVSRGTRSKLLVTRCLAAQAIEQAMKYPVGMKELMDRTEGKVADHIVMDVSGEIVHRMEAARQRVLATKTQEQIPQDVVVEGEYASSKTPVSSQPSPNESDA